MQFIRSHQSKTVQQSVRRSPDNWDWTRFWSLFLSYISFLSSRTRIGHIPAESMLGELWDIGCTSAKKFDAQCHNNQSSWSSGTPYEKQSLATPLQVSC